MADDERRVNTRLSFHATVDVRFPGQELTGCETRDLSLKGVQIDGVGGQKVGDLCDLTLHLSGATSDLILRMKGEVVRVDKRAIAVHFTEIDLDSFYHLKNIIYYNAEDPDHIAEQLIE